MFKKLIVVLSFAVVTSALAGCTPALNALHGTAGAFPEPRAFAGASGARMVGARTSADRDPFDPAP